MNKKSKQSINHYFPKKRLAETQSRSEFLEGKICGLDINDTTSLSSEALNSPIDHSECQKTIKKLESELNIALNKNIALEKTNKDLRDDCKKLKKMFGASTEINLHKDLKIGQLEKLYNASSAELFSQFLGIFSQEDLLDLRKTPPGKRSDSTIVNKCILFLYKRNIEEIACLTVKEKSKVKKVISPSKKTVISQILNDRLQSESITTLEFSERFANVNEHIRNAINNIARSK